MTRTEFIVRLEDLEARLERQTAERDKAAALVDRMDVAIYQLQGALVLMRELVASEPE